MKFRCLAFFIVAVAAILFSASGFAQQAEKTLRTKRLVGTIRIDGHLDEQDWQGLQVATDFTQDWPDLGKPSARKTEVKVLYDNDYLYVGARMHHPPSQASVVKRVHRRDQDSSSDWFGVYVDSLHDRSTAFGFLVNAGGVKRDEMRYNDTSVDSSWDGVWESAVADDEDGWTAEIKIPLTLLRIRPGGGAQTWGINFYRQDQGDVREYSRWECVPRGQTAFVSRFPLLVGIEGLQPRLRREFIPYASSQRKFETTETRFDDRKWANRIGLDAHLGVTTSSQLDLTVWPDFGQVEVDQAVINLGTTETYFQEKRPFFLEGTDLFRVLGQDMFYSRRIGRGVYAPSPMEGETLLDAPRATDIALAAKYTAKMPTGLNYGVLGASVEPARAKMLDSQGAEFNKEIYPLTNFGVARVQQFLDKRGSYIGGFASYMRQASENGREAKSYAVDGMYKSPGRNTTVMASAAMSDAGWRNSDSQNGWRGYLEASRDWGSGLSIAAAAVNADKAYDPNDVGYLNRADLQAASLVVQKITDRRWWVIRNYTASFGADWARDQAGITLQKSVWSRLNFNFMNFWYLMCKLGEDFPAHDDRELRTFNDPVKKYLLIEKRPYLEMMGDTAMNRPYYVQISWTHRQAVGGPSNYYSVSQTIKPHSAFEIQFGTSYTKEEGEMRYVPPKGPDQEVEMPITGLRRLSQFDQTLRLSYAIDPNLTIQFFSQWLAGNWNFRDYMRYVDDNTLAPWHNSTYTADSARNWIVNLITRWEFRPGSTAYLVYTRGASTSQLISQSAGLSPWNDLSVLNRLPSDDAIQLKVSWLFR
ncbi:MAG: carbohydrate binding family 9 domain-containing protein [Holophagales bacterium]|nr:carbohydrate binding family 9 domain-containing protein [Holophagales bacterium]